MPEPALALRGVRVHNLRNIDVDIPLGRLTVIVGVSGAGKSSLAFDTLYAESQRRFLQSFSARTRQYLERFEKPDAEWIGPLPPALAIAAHVPPPARATIGSLTEIGDYLRLLCARAGVLSCPGCGQPVRQHDTRAVVDAVAALEPGTRFTVAFPSRPEEDVDAWGEALRAEGFTRVQVGQQTYRLGEDALPAPQNSNASLVLVDRLEAGRVEPTRLTDSIETAFGRGGGRLVLLANDDTYAFERALRCPRCDREFPPLEPRLFDRNDPVGACPDCDGSAASADAPCPSCSGSGYGELARHVRLQDATIAALGAMPLDELAGWMRDLRLPADKEEQCRLLRQQIDQRLAEATSLDLGHLALDRAAASLSMGVLRRLRLAAALASTLVQALYIVDEPTVDLHPRDTPRLLDALRRLRDAGNTVVVVEHDAAVVAAADHVIELGPGAGEEGGRVVYQGPPQASAAADDSGSSRRRRKPSGHLRLSKADTHNLQDLSVDFPLGVLCAVTGVSGAGKSSLVEETLYAALLQAKKKKGGADVARLQGAGQVEDVILMDQLPLPRSARSNPATYVKIFDDVRALYADTSEARIRNFGPGHFSFNQAGGRCETCEGLGWLAVPMQFLADVTAPCPECRGRRYRPEVLDVKVRSRSIAEVLELTAREAFRFFRAQPVIERRLKFLLDVGLDYLRLGQPADTLSGGECQRLKLAGHLASSRKPRTLFILVEPSAGLHADDVVRLLDCCGRLLESGHSLLLVEHDLDVLAAADHIIDLGPGAGRAGGRVVAAGTPEEVAAVEESATGACLRTKLAHGAAGR